MYPTPKDWELTTINRSCFVHNKLRKPINENDRNKIKGNYPYYGPTKILDYLNEFRLAIMGRFKNVTDMRI